MRDGTSELAQSRPEPEGARPTAQVLQFRARNRSSDRLPARLSAVASEPEGDLLDDLAAFEQDRHEDDDEISDPRRMLMNIIAMAVVTVLIGVGVWLADTIADMERNQDCVLQGRKNCAQVEVPIAVRK